ncbi:MAG: acyltransferase family protein [Desulfobacterales bacterium]|nr:acyltransferase family protein [Desulfobacterales bacterium]
MLAKVTHSALNWINSFIPKDISERAEYFKNNCNAWGYNEWGYSVEWIKRYMAISSWLNKKYFRVKSYGHENVPKGRVLLIGNHSSQMAYDGMIISNVLFMELTPPRFVHAMIGSFFAYQPFYSILMPRIGQIIGTPENCLKLLKEEQTVLVFPEGEKGGGKTIFNRYKLMHFGQGFMELAMETNTPIIPFGFIGGEEMVPSFSRMEPIGKLVGMPYMPLSPTLIFPLPTKCSVYFGEPFLFTGDPLDETLVSKNVDTIKSEIRSLIDKGLQDRKSIF